MARIFKRLFLATADTTAETVYTNSAGQTTKLTELVVAQGSSGLATTIRLSIGADAATTRVFEYPIPAGAGTWIFYPGYTVSGTETFQLSSTVTDDVAVVSGHGFTELSA